MARFCLMPEDDLTLATVLRGPLCDVDEDSLMALCLPCAGRPWNGRLWQRLRAELGVVGLHRRARPHEAAAPPDGLRLDLCEPRLCWAPLELQLR